ncbi:hypothetical protein CMI47_20325 [Candidatus Pacearchaeota archaeon]|nr:hypothetical protein [Candidatus Pacearchaeota archaeon]
MNHFYKTAYDAGVNQALQDHGLRKKGQLQAVESVGQLMAGAGGFLKKLTSPRTHPTRDLTRMQRWLRARLVGPQGRPDSLTAMREATDKAKRLEGLGAETMRSPRAGSVNQALEVIL